MPTATVPDDAEIILADDVRISGKEFNERFGKGRDGKPAEVVEK